MNLMEARAKDVLDGSARANLMLPETLECDRENGSFEGISRMKKT